MSPLAALGRLGVRALDSILRRAYGVRPFSEDPDCILRVAFGSSPRDVRLSDGTLIRCGDPVVHLHLWNERLAALPRERGSLGWGSSLLRLVSHSLHLLAYHLESGPGVAAVAVHGEMGFVTQLRSVHAVLQRLGFDVKLKEAPGWRVWRRAFWDNFYSYLLLWTFSPGGLRGKRLGELCRVEVWMSRAQLLGGFSLQREAVASQSDESGVS